MDTASIFSKLRFHQRFNRGKTYLLPSTVDGKRHESHDSDLGASCPSTGTRSLQRAHMPKMPSLESIGLFSIYEHRCRQSACNILSLRRWARKANHVDRQECVTTNATGHGSHHSRVAVACVIYGRPDAPISSRHPNTTTMSTTIPSPPPKLGKRARGSDSACRSRRR